MKYRILTASLSLALGTPVCAQESEALAAPEPDYDQPNYSASMAEAAWDWRPGDLIFRNGVNDIDEAVKRALGLQWATVGILRASSGGPRVVYVDQSDGVTEEMLYEHVEGLSPDEYAVYRVRDLDPDYDPEEQMGSGPMVRFPLTIAYGAPYDAQFILGDGAFYGAELAYESALNAGVSLGSPIRLRDLLDAPKDADPEFRKMMEEHRYCRYAASFEECWTYDLRNQAVVTTNSLIASGAVDQVYP